MGVIIENKYVRRATVKDLANNDYNFNIPCYVDTYEEEGINIFATQEEIKMLKNKLTEVETKMNQFLTGF